MPTTISPVAALPCVENKRTEITRTNQRDCIKPRTPFAPLVLSANVSFLPGVSTPDPPLNPEGISGSILVKQTLLSRQESRLLRHALAGILVTYGAPRRLPWLRIDN